MARAALPGRLSWRTAAVVAVVPNGRRAATLTLEVEDWSGHRAGQHLDVRLTAEDGYQAQRSYSIASAPGDARVDLTVELIDEGEVSPWLTQEAGPGDTFEVRGPVGGWFVWDGTEPEPALLVAGGSGVVPFVSMARHRRGLGVATPMRLLYSAQSEHDLLHTGELAGLAAAGDGFEVVHTFTRSAPPAWTGYRRRVDAAMLSEVAFPASRDSLVFVCGPTAFVEVVADAVVGLGHPAGAVRTERFGPTGDVP